MQTLGRVELEIHSIYVLSSLPRKSVNFIHLFSKYLQHWIYTRHCFRHWDAQRNKKRCLG